MSLVEVAKIAGVSPATVSRVINGHPQISSRTADAVRRTIKEINFVPAPRRRNHRPAAAKAGRISLVVFERPGVGAKAALANYLHGMSSAAVQHATRFDVAFVRTGEDLSRVLGNGRVDGVLLYGETPDPRIQAQFAETPTVWLTASREHPTRGDQVLPDDTRIGELAAAYLLNRGHKDLAYVGVRSGLWGLDLRSLAFENAAQEGARVHRLFASPDCSDISKIDGLADAVRRLFKQFMGLDRRPSGLFVADGRLLSPLRQEFDRAGVSLGPGAEVEVIACNDGSAYLSRLHPSLPSIDIRAEAIGYRSVEQLCWRIRHPEVSERIRLLVEPQLAVEKRTGSQPV